MVQQGNQRFRILQVALVVIGLALAGRLVQIQVFQHDRHLNKAHSTWSDDIFIPPERGSLYDQALRPLALSVSAWRVGVATSLMPEKPEKLCQLLGEMLDRDSSDLKEELLQAKGRHVVLSPRQILTRDQSMRLQGIKEITLEERQIRVYPFDGMAASLIGFHRKDQEDDISTGLEYSLKGYLAGSPGSARLITTGHLGENLGQVVVSEASHGQNLVLALDADLQGICEKQLELAVKNTGSIGGSVLILDPATGDVLAAASCPLLASRKGRHGDPAVWNNSNFSSMYEPGSVFKIFTAASLLRHGAIDTAMVFDCSDTQFLGFTIRNDEGHAYGPLSFMKAFSKSSNIFFARAVGNLKSEELYRDLMDFGFGQGPGFPYPACAKGILQRPSLWSGRSKATIAIGQEVAVSPLQLGLAICAVANGGTLYSPRMIREVRDEQGRIIEKFPPRPLRRVMSEPLAGLLREAMGRVVHQGTGIAARESWIATGGKTGTAQKSRDGHGYTRGAYVASFGGIVPIDAPRLVILTVLDEPEGVKHYASLSAVPLFREIVRDIRAGTDYLTDALGERTASLILPPRNEYIEVPDVLHLSLDNAGQRLSALGLQIAGAERGGLVIQQVPLPGTRLEPGGMVHLLTGPAQEVSDNSEVFCPNFSGLSNRQVLSLAARMGLRVNIKGAGYAVGQSPAAGLALGVDQIKVRMEAQW